MLIIGNDLLQFDGYTCVLKRPEIRLLEPK